MVCWLRPTRLGGPVMTAITSSVRREPTALGLLFVKARGHLLGRFDRMRIVSTRRDPLDSPGACDTLQAGGKS